MVPPSYDSGLTQLLSGWWLTHPAEKWWSSSVGMIYFPIYGKIKHVPNHKPVMVIITSSPTVSLISLVSLVPNANIAKWAPPCTTTRWVSNLLCRWARRFSFSPAQRFSVSPGNKGQWWFHWLWLAMELLAGSTLFALAHNCSIYLLHPFCGNSCWSCRCF